MPTVELRVAQWAGEVLYKPARRKIVYGGRSGGKTYEIAQALVILAAQGEKSYFGRPLRILLCREIQKSIRESSLAEIKAAIDRMGIPGFKMLQGEIRHKNGSIFITTGLSSVTEESIKSLHGIDIAWAEEAHRLSTRSIELLEPTIRKSGSEIIYSFNPHRRSDPVWIRYIGAKSLPEGTVIKKVCLEHNAGLPDDLVEPKKQAEESRKYDPVRYRHIWRGEPDDDSDLRRLIQYSDLMKCMVSEPKGDEGLVHAGLDLADTGADKNSLVIRKGGYVCYYERFSSRNMNETGRRVHRICKEYGVQKLFYDVTGVGAGMRGFYADLQDGAYRAVPVNFGEKVVKPQRLYTFHGNVRIKQVDKFSRRTAQLGAAVQQRVRMSMRILLDGKGDLSSAFWVNSNMAEPETFLVQLSQPVEEEDPSGRMRIIKRPKLYGAKSESPSPDFYDATILAFAQDSAYGLTAPKLAT